MACEGVTGDLELSVLAELWESPGLWTIKNVDGQPGLEHRNGTTLAPKMAGSQISYQPPDFDAVDLSKAASAKIFWLIEWEVGRR